MYIKRFEDMGESGLDIVREVGSIGTGNAAAALSELLNMNVRISVPEVKILGYDDAVEALGSPEDIVTAVLVEVTSELKGMMLFLMKLDFINAILEPMLGKKIDSYDELTEMEVSAVTEVGNIIISSYMNGLSRLTDFDIDLSVPAFSLNMLGGILTVPMIEQGYEDNKIMIIQGKFLLGKEHHDSNLLMMLDISSLNNLFKKLVITDE